MWTFQQNTGEIYWDGNSIGVGYAGSGAGKNNPAMQQDRDIGPLPCGFYAMTELRLSDPRCGEYVIVLTPDSANEMFGRSDFRWHGDSIKNPGHGSDGCICSPRPIRMEAWESTDHRLQVVSGE